TAELRVDRSVVRDQQDVIGGHLQVQLEVVHAGARGLYERVQGVLRPDERAAAVGDHVRAGGGGDQRGESEQAGQGQPWEAGHGVLRMWWKIATMSSGWSVRNTVAPASRRRRYAARRSARG